jgi:PAS domain S-box-containing protein
MFNQNIDLKILRELSKDENSYKKLLDLIGIDSSGDSITPTSKEVGVNFKYFFWSIANLKDKEEWYYSNSIKNITGFSERELKHLPDGLQSLIHEDDLHSVKKKLLESEENPSKNLLVLTYRINTKEGNTIWLNEEINFIRDEKGKIIKSISFGSDISKIKTEELKLKQSCDRYQDLNSAKDKFISIVSHDLRSPFTSLLGFSEILLNEDSLPESEKKEYLEYIYDSSKIQLQLINYLLDWSRLQTGRLQIEPRKINVRDLVSNCVSVLTGTAIRKKINLKVEIDKNLYFYVDERLIIQSITNLISNAIKFTPSNKSVVVSAAKFKEGMIEIIVQDEGLGISEKNQSKLFQIDQKLILVGTDGEKGTGLGLTLVKEIVEKHNGDIWFYSQLNEGSEFHISLPEAKNSVLLVESDLSTSQTYKELLKKTLSSFEILHVPNGYEAMSIIINTPPSLVITDHEMPLMNGIQLVEAMRKKKANKNVPVIIVSTEINDEIENKYRALGVTSILQKPVNSSQFIDAVKECAL